jgi:hypothetical protein
VEARPDFHIDQDAASPNQLSVLLLGEGEIDSPKASPEPVLEGLAVLEHNLRCRTWD